MNQDFVTKKQVALTYFGVNLFLIFLWMLSPVASIFAISLFLAHFGTTRNVCYFYFFLIATVPALINVTKIPVTDLEMYNDTFREFWNAGFEQVSKTILLDPFFYYTSFFLVKLSQGNLHFLVFFWTVFMYFIFFVALYEFDKLFFSSNRWKLIAVLFFSVFIGIDFQLSGHLLRQCNALSLMMLGLVLFSKRKKSYLVFFLLAILTHFSTIIFIPIIVITRLKKIFLIPVIFGLLIVGYMLASMNILEVVNRAGGLGGNAVIQAVSDRAQMYEEKDDGSVSVRLWIEIVIYFVVSVIIMTRTANFLRNRKLPKVSGDSFLCTLDSCSLWH